MTTTLQRYAARYPHLRSLVAKAQAGDLRALRAIATQAGIIAAPAGVTGGELLALISAAAPRANKKEGK